MRDLTSPMNIFLDGDKSGGEIVDHVILQNRQSGPGRQNAGRKGCPSYAPFRMKYKNSYAKAFPFPKLIDGMLDRRMIEDTVQLVREGFRKERRISIINNTREGIKRMLIL